MKSIGLVYLLFITVAYGQSTCNEIFVDRAGWGARESTSITNLTAKPLSFFVIHHAEDPPSCYDDESCIKLVREIQIFHQNNQSWVDIGYHFLVGENGKVYEGRGWNRQGAHSPGWNNYAYGISFIGNFNASSPNVKALKAARSWIACSVERRYVTEEFYVITHRQSQRPGYTTCPGNALFNVIRSWPEFCSFQNPGGNLTGNNTWPSIALKFCAKKLESSSSRILFPLLSTSAYPMTSMFLFYLLIIYFS